MVVVSKLSTTLAPGLGLSLRTDQTECSTGRIPILRLRNGPRENMRKGNSRGFTLIEVLVSAALLGVGVAGVLTGMGSLNKAQARAIEVEHVQRLALRKLDE